MDKYEPKRDFKGCRDSSGLLGFKMRKLAVMLDYDLGEQGPSLGMHQEYRIDGIKLKVADNGPSSRFVGTRHARIPDSYPVMAPTWHRVPGRMSSFTVLWSNNGYF